MCCVIDEKTRGNKIDLLRSLNSAYSHTQCLMSSVNTTHSFSLLDMLSELLFVRDI